VLPLFIKLFICFLLPRILAVALVGKCTLQYNVQRKQAHIREHIEVLLIIRVFLQLVLKCIYHKPFTK